MNHIIGYAEMLMEQAPPDSQPALRDIRAAGREILERVNRVSGGRAETASAIADSVQTILRRLDELRSRAPSSEVRSDLEKIDAAARSLMDTGAPKPAQEAESCAPAAASAGSRARLLVTDDNEVNRDLLVRRLRGQGFAVDEAKDGREALTTLRAGAYDLLLLDIMMPEMDGFEVLSQLKSDRHLCGLPVIVISALDEMEIVVRAIQMGAEDYLSKPFDPVLLRARISASLEKKRLRDELALRERLASLGAVAAGIAHEIKNPLNFIVNFAGISAELLRDLRPKLDELPPGPSRDDTLALAADLEQSIGKIQQHGNRADSIVRSMLAHSRAEAGERRPTDINALLREFVNLAFHAMRSDDPSFQAVIDFDLDPEAGSIDAMPQDLSRVFINIAGNAFYALNQRAKSGEAGYRSELRVSTRNLGDRVEIRVRDNGPGIPKTVLDRVFDPFFTTKPAGEGTGLGLSISYEIVVREHGGEMRAESEEGRFTEFILTLPRRMERP